MYNIIWAYAICLISCEASKHRGITLCELSFVAKLWTVNCAVVIKRVFRASWEYNECLFQFTSKFSYKYVWNAFSHHTHYIKSLASSHNVNVYIQFEKALEFGNFFIFFWFMFNVHSMPMTIDVLFHTYQNDSREAEKKITEGPTQHPIPSTRKPTKWMIYSKIWTKNVLLLSLLFIWISFTPCTNVRQRIRFALTKNLFRENVLRPWIWIGYGMLDTKKKRR